MISSTFTTFLLTLFALFTLGASVPISPRDVFVPPVLYPNAATVWKVGHHHNVTWNVTDAPEHITNPVGQIYLAKAGIINLDDPLAKGFNITNGRQEIQVPNVESRSDYTIVLFGDSGNDSAEFTITSD